MATDYAKQTWADEAAGNTPLSAVRLTHIEDGLGDHAHTDAATQAELDAHAATSHGEPHPDLTAHDTLGLATQAELDAHAATSHGTAHPDLAAHDTLGLATQTELDTHAATAGHTHPDLTAHDTLGLATQAELDTHAATPHGSTHPTGIHVLSPGNASAYAIGTGALAANSATGANNIAIGDGALDVNTTGTPNLAMGTNALGANTTGANNIAIGHGALHAPNGLAANATTTGARNIAIGVETGQNTSAQVNDTVAIGHRALVEAFGLAIGPTAKARGSYGIAIGAFAQTLSWVGGIAIGASSDVNSSPQTNERGAIAIGNGQGWTQTGPRATGPCSVAIGSTITTAGGGANASGWAAVAIGGTLDGVGARASGNRSVALGENSNAAHANSVALGDGSATTAAAQVNIGTKRLFAGAPATAPLDAELIASQVSFWLDETGNALTFRVKYADGTTIKSGTVALA